MKKAMVMLLVVVLAVVPMMALVAAGPALSDSGTATLYPEKDAQVSLIGPDTPMGAQTHVTVHAGNINTTGRGEFQFNLDSLPVGAAITSANFSAYYYANDGTAPNGSVYEINPNTAAWTESGVTWNNDPAFGATSATATVPTSYGWMKWDITTLVQSWLSTPATNYGFVVMDSNESGGVDRWTRFYSREVTGTAFDPKLEIEYTYTTTTQVGIPNTELVYDNWQLVDVTVSTTGTQGIGSYSISVDVPIAEGNVTFESMGPGLSLIDASNSGNVSHQGVAVSAATGGQVGPGLNLVLFTVNISMYSPLNEDSMSVRVGIIDLYDGTGLYPGGVISTANTTSTVTYHSRIVGDINADNDVTLADTQLVVQHIQSYFTLLSGDDLLAGDVSGTVHPDMGPVWINDVQLMMQYNLGIITVFPGGAYIP